MVKRLLALLAVAAMLAVAVVVRGVVTGKGVPGLVAAKGADGPLVVRLVCAEEIAAYCRSSVDEFTKSKPTVAGRPVSVRLDTADSGATARSLQGAAANVPLVWIPASNAWIDQANAAWRGANGTDLFFTSGQYQALPIAESPTVFLGTRARLEVLGRFCGGKFTWQCLRRATVTDGGWGAIGGDPNWGLVKFGYANPLTTNTGLLSLILMTYGYYQKVSGLTPADVTNTEFVAFLRDLGFSVTQFADSAAAYQRDLVITCPGAYDVAMTYEFTAATSIKNAAGRGCDLVVAYPTINVRSDFPFAIAATGNTSATEKDAALALRDFFYSEANQRRALGFGLRPTNPDVAIVGTTQNPLADNTAAGIQLQLPRADVADFPSFDVVSTLLQTWQQKVERR